MRSFYWFFRRKKLNKEKKKGRKEKRQRILSDSCHGKKRKNRKKNGPTKRKTVGGIDWTVREMRIKGSCYSIFSYYFFQGHANSFTISNSIIVSSKYWIFVEKFNSWKCLQSYVQKKKNHKRRKCKRRTAKKKRLKRKRIPYDKERSEIIKRKGKQKAHVSLDENFHRKAFWSFQIFWPFSRKRKYWKKKENEQRGRVRRKEKEKENSFFCPELYQMCFLWFFDFQAWKNGRTMSFSSFFFPLIPLFCFYTFFFSVFFSFFVVLIYFSSQMCFLWFFDHSVMKEWK